MGIFDFLGGVGRAIQPLARGAAYTLDPQGTEAMERINVERELIGQRKAEATAKRDTDIAAAQSDEAKQYREANMKIALDTSLDIPTRQKAAQEFYGSFQPGWTPPAQGVSSMGLQPKYGAGLPYTTPGGQTGLAQVSETGGLPVYHQPIPGSGQVPEFGSPDYFQDPVTGETTAVRAAKTGGPLQREVVPGLKGATMPSTAKTTISAIGQQVSPATAATTTRLQDDIASLDTDIAGLENALKLLESGPSFLTVGGSVAEWAQGTAEKVTGKPVLGSEYMRKRSEFRATAENSFLKFRKFITGVAGGIQEFTRIEGAFPSIKKDGPTQYSGKASAALHNMKVARSIAQKLLANGFDISDKNKPVPASAVEAAKRQLGVDFEFPEAGAPAAAEVPAEQETIFQNIEGGGRVRVIAPNGKRGSVSANKLEAALKAGYKRAE